MEKEARRIKVPTTGVCDFPSLILGGRRKYVDKTDLLYRLANEADQQLFISRPRRFGKSLMLSTLKSMFEGRRELFKGLAIDKLPWEGWEQPTPVYSFTMSSAVGGTYELFREQLAKLVKTLCAQPEVATMLGYADAVIETPTDVYVFEFKYHKSAKAAIRQIRERGYADRWIGGDRPVTLVGINFNPKKRNIDMPIIEPA